MNAGYWRPAFGFSVARNFFSSHPGSRPLRAQGALPQGFYTRAATPINPALTIDRANLAERDLRKFRAGD
jgi:hypothetical protein